MALLTKLLCFSDPQGFRAQGHGGVMERAGRRLHNSSRHLRFLHVFPPPAASSKDPGGFPEWLLP